MQGEDFTTRIHDIEDIQKKDWFRSHSISANFSFNDNDKIKTLLVTTGAGNITVILPTVADNLDRVIEIIKVDNTFDKTGASTKITVDGEGAETINGQITIDVELQYCGLRIKSNGTEWIVLDTIGDCELRDISGTLELIYKKVFLGITDNDNLTIVAHGVSLHKIIQCCSSVGYNANIYFVYEIFLAADVNAGYYLQYDTTNIYLTQVGASLRVENYRIQIEYYV